MGNSLSWKKNMIKLFWGMCSKENCLRFPSKSRENVRCFDLVCMPSFFSSIRKNWACWLYIIFRSIRRSEHAGYISFFVQWEKLPCILDQNIWRFPLDVAKNIYCFSNRASAFKIVSICRTFGLKLV